MSATARQDLLTKIIRKCGDASAVIAYVASGPINSGLDTAGVVHRVAADGLSEIPGGQSPDAISVAIENAIFNSSNVLAKAIFQGEQQRQIAGLQTLSSGQGTAKAQTDATITAYQGVTFT
jgi:hypothetical protein